MAQLGPESTISSIAIGEAQKKIEQTPQDGIAPPTATGSSEVDEAVIDAFPVPASKLMHAFNYGESLWGKTAKLQVQLPNGELTAYFLKVVTLGETGRSMCQGEFESLKAIYAVSPGFVPRPYAWGKFRQQEASPATCFLLAEFRDVGEQPADPVKLTARLADLHQRSQSPTGKFGFHYATTHARIAQAVDQWDESWCNVFARHLEHIMNLAKGILRWPEFDVVSEDWDARNLLYSLTFNIGNTIYIPGSQQRDVVYEDMTALCKMFCRNELKTEMERLKPTGNIFTHLAVAAPDLDVKAVHNQEEGQEEEEEEEEEDED
ncbi:MAG: hypothetical protein M1831_005718 [Alyxoria varia]|nr:MAG: hypothetical protein M1831_005718 [Alyxoria varia]